MRFALLVAVGVLLAIQAAAAARAEPRIALVIGNGDYQEQRRLANPVNDAALMTETLLAVGFEVLELTDADQPAIKRAIRRFGKRLRAAGPTAVGLFYYAGHGVQAGGANFLIPLGAEIEDEADLDLEAVNASALLAQMASAGNALNIVILDACRNNPYRSSFRSAVRGLARMDAPSGSLVAYAAAPGQVAADGPAANSPYTAALAAAMREPGLDLVKLFQRVRREVLAATDGRQTPWEEQSLLGDFAFVPAQEAAATEAPSPGAADARAFELAFWDSVKDSRNPAALESYLERYPDGVFSGLARVRIAALGVEGPPRPYDGAFYAGHWCERIGQYLVRWEVVHLAGNRVRTRMHHPAAPSRFLPEATVTPIEGGLRVAFAGSADDLVPQVFKVLDDRTILRQQPAPAEGMNGIRKRCERGDESR